MGGYLPPRPPAGFKARPSQGPKRRRDLDGGPWLGLALDGRVSEIVVLEFGRPVVGKYRDLNGQWMAWGLDFIPAVPERRG